MIVGRKFYLTKIISTKTLNNQTLYSTDYRKRNQKSTKLQIIISKSKFTSQYFNAMSPSKTGFEKCTHCHKLHRNMFSAHVNGPGRSTLAALVWSRLWAWTWQQKVKHKYRQTERNVTVTEDLCYLFEFLTSRVVRFTLLLSQRTLTATGKTSGSIDGMCEYSSRRPR